jgi:hypothetical protein
VEHARFGFYHEPVIESDMRTIATLPIVLLLGACNMVTSDRPWFTPEAEANAPRLRSGLWLS